MRWNKIHQKYFDEFLSHDKRNQLEGLFDRNISYGAKIREKQKEMLDKIFLGPVEGISDELQADLATGSKKIITRQKIRMVDRENNEMFENISIAPYTLDENKRRHHRSLSHSSTSHRSSKNTFPSRSFITHRHKPKHDQSSSILNEQHKLMSNAYTYHPSNSFDDTNYNNKHHRGSSSMNLYPNPAHNKSQSKSYSTTEPPQVFK